MVSEEHVTKEHNINNNQNQYVMANISKLMKWMSEWVNYGVGRLSNGDIAVHMWSVMFV